MTESEQIEILRKQNALFEKHTAVLESIKANMEDVLLRIALLAAEPGWDSKTLSSRDAFAMVRSLRNKCTELEQEKEVLKAAFAGIKNQMSGLSEAISILKAEQIQQ